jgi:hypothetical protein
VISTCGIYQEGVFIMLKNYCPEYGYRYQILCKSGYDRAFEHCDYATNRQEKNYLLGEYSMAYGNGFQFKVVQLPYKYWHKV